jgi:DNA-binding MarR family transcriptional regulator
MSYGHHAVELEEGAADMTGHTTQGAMFTELVLETFRLNGRLLAAGDRMTRPLGLTSARWQVLGAVEDGALPVAQIARNMGLTRQAVQRIANVLRADKLVEFTDNPNHRRSRLVGLTAKGRAVLAEAMVLQTDWANGLAAELLPDRLAAALSVLRTIRQLL